MNASRPGPHLRLHTGQVRAITSLTRSTAGASLPSKCRSLLKLRRLDAQDPRRSDVNRLPRHFRHGVQRPALPRDEVSFCL